MDCLMHIGNNLDPKAQESLITTIERIFDSGLKNHVGDVTLCRALEVVENAYSVKNIHVNNCTLTGKGK